MRSPRLAALFAASLALGGIALAEGTVYRFFFAKDLAARIENEVGKGVKVVDVLAKIWESQEIDGWIRFDTEHFRCVVPAAETESIAYLREVQKALDEKRSAVPPLVAIYATVSREPLFGPTKGGESEGVASEEILLKADRIERPRERFWEEGH